MKVIGLAGWSGTGKTTLLKKLIPRLVARGLSIATAKHAHHAFDVDTPGKDSYEHREAGAGQVLVASARRYALMRELRTLREPSLGELLRKLDPCDLVIVEGFKAAGHPKIALHRSAVEKPLILPEVSNVKALLSDRPIADWSGPAGSLDDMDAAEAFVLRHAEPLDAVLAILDTEAAPA